MWGGKRHNRKGSRREKSRKDTAYPGHENDNKAPLSMRPEKLDLGKSELHLQEALAENVLESLGHKAAPALDTGWGSGLLSEARGGL